MIGDQYSVLMLMQGASHATTVEVLRLWSTSAERSRIIAGVSAGGLFGVLLCFPICGSIAYYFNWRAVFYVTGRERWKLFFITP